MSLEVTLLAESGLLNRLGSSRQCKAQERGQPRLGERSLCTHWEHLVLLSSTELGQTGCFAALAHVDSEDSMSQVSG